MIVYHFIVMAVIHFVYIYTITSLERTNNRLQSGLGKKISQKLTEVRAALKDLNADSIVVTSLDDVACKCVCTIIISFFCVT